MSRRCAGLFRNAADDDPFKLGHCFAPKDHAHEPARDGLRFIRPDLVAFAIAAGIEIFQFNADESMCPRLRLEEDETLELTIDAVTQPKQLHARLMIFDPQESRARQ